MLYIDSINLPYNSTTIQVYCNDCINIIHNENMEELTDKLKKELINSGYTINNYCSNCNKMIGSEIMPRIIKAKLYKCKRCGFEKMIETNHYGNCYSMNHYNTCQNCPPWAKYPEFGGQTIWICQETEGK